MALDMTNFEDDITLFLETQTVACHTPSVIGDAKMDGKKRRAYHAGRQMHTPWKAEDIALLENGAVFRDPQRPLLTALAADLVSLRKQPCWRYFPANRNILSVPSPRSEDEYTG